MPRHAPHASSTAVAEATQPDPAVAGSASRSRRGQGGSTGEARRNAIRSTVPSPRRLGSQLGSLTQLGARSEHVCDSCGSERVTHLAMTLTDGTSVDFVSCHRCERRTWTDPDGMALPVERVLDKTRKLR